MSIWILQNIIFLYHLGLTVVRQLSGVPFGGWASEPSIGSSEKSRLNFGMCYILYVYVFFCNYTLTAIKPVVLLRPTSRSSDELNVFPVLTPREWAGYKCQLRPGPMEYRADYLTAIPATPWLKTNMTRTLAWKLRISPITELLGQSHNFRNQLFFSLVVFKGWLQWSLSLENGLHKTQHP